MLKWVRESEIHCSLPRTCSSKYKRLMFTTASYGLPKLQQEWVWSWWSRESTQIYSLLHVHLNLWMPMRPMPCGTQRGMYYAQLNWKIEKKKSPNHAIITWITQQRVSTESDSTFSGDTYQQFTEQWIEWWIVVGCSLLVILYTSYFSQWNCTASVLTSSINKPWY